MSELSVTALKHESATSDNITLASNGNVGIGTSSPNFPLSFGANLNKTIAVYENGGASVYGIGMGGDGSAGDPYRTKVFANGFEYLSVDFAGRVTMPYQPHARVSKNNGNIPGGSVIVFNFADENTAGVYNASNGRFTAPVAGRYLFAHGMFSGTGYNAYLAWRVNGTVIATTYDNNSNYDSVAGSIVLSMSAGDYADLFVVSGASYQIYGTTAVQCWATFTLLS